VRVVPASGPNWKITTAVDLALAEALLRREAARAEGAAPGGARDA
jgi:2-C-methyl-D-erythritol 4-phosphate cytidylyltransferase